MVFVTAIDGAKRPVADLAVATLFLDTAVSRPYRECVQAFVPERSRSLMQSG